LARDLEQTIADAQHLGDDAKNHFNPSRIGAGALASISSMLELTSNALRSLSDKTKKKLTFTTGEVTSAGTLTCQKCEQKVHLKKTSHIPPCPKCHGALFQKGY
jgi:isocitrate dehydrogenase